MRFAAVASLFVGLVLTGCDTSSSDSSAGTNERRWRFIVIHHSATAGGNADRFDAEHRRRGFDELGYHFVITNGLGGSDGAVEVGSRWTQQKHGAHCAGTPDNEYNEHGIGICLVGDFRSSPPSEAQLLALRDLVTRLLAEHGMTPDDVVCHCDAPNARTECPGGKLHNYVVWQLRPELWRQSQ